MIGAFDIQYGKNGGASAAAVVFSDYGDAEPVSSYTILLPDAAHYIPGEFYRRELPGILGLLKRIDARLDEVIIDAYVKLGDRPGLGQLLYMALDRKIPVIGVAKSEFKGASAAKVYRGGSIRPLYVTAIGLPVDQAAAKIQKMHGGYRIPTLLKRVDAIARQAVQYA